MESMARPRIAPMRFRATFPLAGNTCYVPCQFYRSSARPRTERSLLFMFLAVAHRLQNSRPVNAIEPTAPFVVARQIRVLSTIKRCPVYSRYDNIATRALLCTCAKAHTRTYLLTCKYIFKRSQDTFCIVSVPIPG